MTIGRSSVLVYAGAGRPRRRVMLRSAPGRIGTGKVRKTFRAATKRRGGTRTVTKSKRQTPKESVHGGVGGSESKFFTQITHPEKKLIQKVTDISPPQVFCQNTIAQLSWSAGLQGCLSLQTLNTKDMFVNIMTNEANQMAAAATATNMGAQYQHIYLVDAYTETYFTNQANVSARLKLFDVMCRRDLNEYYPPDYCFQEGLTNVTTADYAANYGESWSLPGVGPFGSPLFTQLYKVKKITEVVLPPGSVHMHKQFIRAHKRLPTAATAVDYGNSYYGIGGWTHYLMAIGHGYPANDSSNTNLISTQAGRIDMVVNNKYTFKVMQVSQTTKNLYINNLSAWGTTGSLVTEEGNNRANIVLA